MINRFNPDYILKALGAKYNSSALTYDKPLTPVFLSFSNSTKGTDNDYTAISAAGNELSHNFWIGDLIVTTKVGISVTQIDITYYTITNQAGFFINYLLNNTTDSEQIAIFPVMFNRLVLGGAGLPSDLHFQFFGFTAIPTYHE